jgi:hypothetical protein
MRASHACASLYSESETPRRSGGRTPSVLGYEPRKRTSAQIRCRPISASPTRASSMWPYASTEKK